MRKGEQTSRYAWLLVFGIWYLIHPSARLKVSSLKIPITNQLDSGDENQTSYILQQKRCLLKRRRQIDRWMDRWIEKRKYFFPFMMSGDGGGGSGKKTSAEMN